MHWTPEKVRTQMSEWDTLQSLWTFSAWPPGLITIRNPGEFHVRTQQWIPSWIHSNKGGGGGVMLLTHDRHKNKKKNLPLSAAHCCFTSHMKDAVVVSVVNTSVQKTSCCVKGRLQVNSGAYSPDLTRRSWLKKAEVRHFSLGWALLKAAMMWWNLFWTNRVCSVEQSLINVKKVMSKIYKWCFFKVPLWIYIRSLIKGWSSLSCLS